MQFNEKEDHSITLEQARRWTKNYRETAGKDAPLGAFYGKEAVLELLIQEEVVGFRYYNAINDDGDSVLVLVGVNSDGDDVYEGNLMELGVPCPPYCSSANPLNT
ncbi:MAG: hypothetical protein K9N46_03175 [Candidatus Marinimicrobia bacterium]|nr:hypothetical protein [Candidatus Neomarinimicrobiota bacterium]MCF7828100.1 hypothetical protein [Candidatus Neomarinimicrobiota bacterium]MCF7879725.1 hypothetical protein [Candidatus Neomarinimicrobiota bacterium]